MQYLEDSEELKVGLSELEEQLEMLENAGNSTMQIAKQTRETTSSSGSSDKKKNEAYIANLARWTHN